MSNTNASRALITFTAEHAFTSAGTSVEGMSGGVSNSDFIRELEVVAIEHVRNCHDGKTNHWSLATLMILAPSN